VYSPSDEEDAEVLGSIDIKNCEDIIEVRLSLQCRHAHPSHACMHDRVVLPARRTASRLSPSSARTCSSRKHPRSLQSGLPC
jgi:hypothetical protein